MTVRPFLVEKVVRVELELPAGEATISLEPEEATRVARALLEGVEYLEFMEDGEADGRTA